MFYPLVNLIVMAKVFVFVGVSADYVQGARCSSVRLVIESFDL